MSSDYGLDMKAAARIIQDNVVPYADRPDQSSREASFSRVSYRGHTFYLKPERSDKVGTGGVLQDELLKAAFDKFIEAKGAVKKKSIAYGNDVVQKSAFRVLGKFTHSSGRLAAESLTPSTAQRLRSSWKTGHEYGVKSAYKEMSRGIKKKKPSKFRRGAGLATAAIAGGLTGASVGAKLGVAFGGPPGALFGAASGGLLGGLAGTFGAAKAFPPPPPPPVLPMFNPT